MVVEHYRVLVLACLLSVLLLAACGSGGVKSEDQGPLLSFDSIPKHKGFKHLWSISLGTSASIPLAARRLIYDSEILYAAGGGKLFALNASNGRQLWYELVAVDDIAIGGGFGRLFTASRSGSVAVYNTQGEQLWNTRVGGEVLVGPESNGDIVVVHTHAGELLAFDLINGSERWKYNYDQPSLLVRGSGAPQFRLGAVIVGRADGYLSLHEAVNGVLITQFPITEADGENELERLADIDGAFGFLGEQLFLASYQHTVVGVDLRNGTPLWQRQNFGAPGGVTFRRGRLYLATNDGVVMALQASDGEDIWRHHLYREQQPLRPLVFRDMLVVPVAKGLVLLDLDTGDLRGKLSVSGGVVSALVVEDYLYLLSSKGQLSAYYFRW